MNQPHILAFSYREDTLDCFRKHLGDSGRLDVADSKADPEVLIRREEPDLLLVDPDVNPPADRDPLRVACRIAPDLPAVLIASTDSSSCYSYLKSYGLGAAIPPSLGASPCHCHLLLKHLKEPASLFQPEQYAPDGSEMKMERIVEASIRLDDQEEMIRDFESTGYVDMHDFRLIFEEVINNAIYHAFHNRRLSPGASDGENAVDTKLDTRDVLELSWAVGDDYSMLSVMDNRGQLSRQAVWDCFLRQTNLSGLLDTSGRGLYLTFLLSKMLLVSVKPGEKTQVVVFFGPGASREAKPLSIQMCR
ncbi:MAG: hypothetical protein ACLFUS_09890 [Candidatus Sumerlaeia bacterium]